MKYIADLPERYIEKRPDGDKWLQMPVNVSGHELMIKTVIPLTPYTEPDLDAVRNEAYDKGYHDAVMKIGSDEQAIAEKAYRRGLDDAWDTARKIVLSKEIGGLFDFDSVKAVFGCGTFLALKKYSASEAIKKIRQYEQEQEEIKVGDEVQHRNHSGIKIIVLEKGGDVITAIAVTNVPFCCKVGDMYINSDVKDWKRTGKHYVIAEILRKLKEGEE